MSSYPVVKREGRLADAKYNKKNSCLLIPCNAISYKGVGLAKEIGFLYPYGDVYKDRRRLYNLSRCVKSDRENVGSIKILKPSKNEDGPYIIGVVSQFSVGRPVEENQYAKHYIDTSFDKHFVEGLKKDTSEARLVAFNECIKKVTTFVMGNNEISTIFICLILIQNYFIIFYINIY